MSALNAPLTMENSDERFTAWMRSNLARAADHFNVVMKGTPVFGWRLRSIGAPAVTRDGCAPRWLRVVSEYPQWAHGDTWVGNVEAGELTGIVKPVVLAFTEWEDGGRQQRAELMTCCPGDPVSVTDVLRQEVDLDARSQHVVRSTGQEQRGNLVVGYAATARTAGIARSLWQAGRATVGTTLRIAHARQASITEGERCAQLASNIAKAGDDIPQRLFSNIADW